MRDNMYENKWSPFDPNWYNDAFDRYISTADQLFNTDLIIDQGYNIPDSDGSRSSIFRNEAVLNNSFDENKLRESLKDIYTNSTHKLVASNHDNTHFFKWFGRISDMTFIPNTKYCEFKIPTDEFIYPSARDNYKLSQYYRNWIKVEDILNNWDIFRWHCMLFINQRVYSEYELRIDDHETTIKFRYSDIWVKENYPIYIYKFDTSAQCRILISRELCKRQWNWKIPLNYINDSRVTNSTNLMVAINKISDTNIRTDGLSSTIQVLGDNLEFLHVKDGYIDLSNISRFNKIYIESEATEYLWMSLIVPKFFHEYPILLPTDVIFRPYEANFQPVSTIDHEVVQHVKSKFRDTDENRQVYVDLNGHLHEDYNGWRQMIRPVVLSDSYDGEHTEPYNGLETELDNLRDLTVKGADIIENFRFFLKEYNITTDDFNKYIKDILIIMHSIREAHNAFLDRLLIEYNLEYERRYKKFQRIMKTIETDGIDSEWLKQKAPEEETKDNDFWFMVSPLIYIPRELADKYYIIDIMSGMGEKESWYEDNNYLNQLRFKRPIEENDFWTFEYYGDDMVWRPYPLSMKRNFPDVYLPTDPTEETPTLNRIFKTFFFYSDTMNVTDESSDIIRATPSWDTDVDEYHIDQYATYRDIFMEKFYWMGVRAIYKELLKTNNRWEVIEYVIDNKSYDRFNQLFLTTMDPYFKLGLATYLKSDNYEFPFDDAINKMEEAINTNWLGYKKVTNFEVYLNKTWIPSYFDYITKIMDDWDYTDRLVKRPRSTFDIDRLLPILIEIQNEIFSVIETLRDLISWILSKLYEEDYNLNVKNIEELKSTIDKMYDNMSSIISFTTNLDIQIYSIDDINHIIELLRKHIELTDILRNQFKSIYDDVCNNNIYQDKRDLLNMIIPKINDLATYISKIVALVHDFDMNGFMHAVNDLRSYFFYAKINPDDNSLIAHINRFDDPWSVKVKESRNKLFQSTSILYRTYQPNKIYENEEVIEFIQLVNNVKNDISNLRNSIDEFWVKFNYEKDQEIIDKLDYTESLISNFVITITEYTDAREDLLSQYREISRLIQLFDQYNISETEKKYIDGIMINMLDIVRALSYLAGKDDKDEALNALNRAKAILLQWKLFIDTEEEVFTKLLELSESPIELLEILDKHQNMIEAIIEYMDTVNIVYVPNNSFPTYSDIYQVEEVNLISGGFNNNVDETIYAPSLGVYKISETSGNSNTVTDIDYTNNLNTSFRDPSTNARPYDSITNGIGVGITLSPTKVKHIRIINDEIINNLIMKIQNAIYIVDRDTKGANPHWNIELSKDLDIIKDIQSSWSDTLEIYSEYMSDTIKQYSISLLVLLMNLIRPCESFIEFRNRIKVTEFLDMLEEFIYSSYECIEKLDKLTEDFYYNDNNLRLSFNEINNFYDNGATWSDGNALTEILYRVYRELESYKLNVLDLYPDDMEEQVKMYEDIVIIVNTIRTTIPALPNMLIDVSFTLRQIKSKLNSVPELQKDIWFKFKSINIANPGRGYKVGDIVEIEQEVDNSIYVQITKVDNGKVSHVKPLIDYAIPYSIYGITDTITKVGNGENLVLDIYTKEIKLSDSTLFNDKNSDINKPPIFDENDMFMFKFENIYDLDMNYEVFLGGKQITDFYCRHEASNNPLHPKDIDVIYINANDVMNLQNSSIFIPAEHYFVYKLDKIEIVDPGVGYAINQNIVVDTDKIALRLKVSKLKDNPFKQIDEVDIIDASTKYKFDDPSSDNARVVIDSLNNIDDEYNNGYYDKLMKDGITKPATLSYDQDMYSFKSHRYDNLEDGDRNKTFMYPDINLPAIEGIPTNGDPDYNWYQGSRIDNSQHPIEDTRRWNGIMNIIPPTDPFIPDNRRYPTNKPPKGEYQLICRERIHNSFNETNTDVNKIFDESIKNNAMIGGDLQVPFFKDLPKHVEDYPEGRVGRNIIVDMDETMNNHRTLYRIRTFVAAGFFVYDRPVYADFKWNEFNVNWMDIDCYHDYPSIKAKYKSIPWQECNSYRQVQHLIDDKKYEDEVPTSLMNKTSYIHEVTVDDLSVFNWTTKEWEDLHDDSRWKLTTYDYGFKLEFLEEGIYSYDMRLYLNKVPDTQIRNSELKKDAIMNVSAVILKEINTAAINYNVNTSRHLRIRKLFPYKQTETFVIGMSENKDPLGYEMNFKLAPYMHFKNQIHLEDVKIFNKSANRFEDILDRRLFEVRFKDDRCFNRGFETQTRILQTAIGNPGEGFIDGKVWGYNEEFGIHIFGEVTADFINDGHLLTFKPLHCPNPPSIDISLEFQVFQHYTQSEMQMAIVLIEFHTERVEVYGDGYIHDVSNPLAPIPDEFKIIAQYNLDSPTEYEVIIDKTQKEWNFSKDNWMINPTFHLDKCNINSDQLYVLTDKGRFPIINPSTNKPSLYVTQTGDGTDVTFLNLYRRYEKFTVRSMPYPMRSVYVQRKIPSHGYLDLKGKINKPLNKKYFEFWVNGKLLYDEVTIISPTKIFLHGLKSLKNLEIIEINRDPNEYFSDNFINVSKTEYDRPYVSWDYDTYLDNALLGTLDGDNYTEEEQEYLLSPIWKQVEKDHPEFKNYPPNTDQEDDILLRVNTEDGSLEGLDNPIYQFLVLDTPTLEGHPILEHKLSFEHFGFRPITDNMLIDMMNEEWQYEIEHDPYLQEHFIMSDDEWYGMATRLYDEYGIQVHNLDESVYHITDTDLLRINAKSKLSRIVKNNVYYDLD